MTPARATPGGDPAPPSPADPPPPTLVVRKAVAADLPALGWLGALLVAVHHDFDAARFFPAGPGTEQGYAQFLATQLEAPDAVVLVAEAGGTVLGYSYAALEGLNFMALRGPAGVLQDIIVDPAQRRRGAGRLLLDAALAALRDLGARQVVLSTAHRNAAAQRLFAAAGFRPTMIEMTRELP